MFLLVKRGADIAGALALLLLLLPLMLAIATTIAVTSGTPVLYTQLRFGRSGRPFRILKFRTMHRAECDTTETRQTAPHDPRVTALGRYLRALDLDELPQIVNVLKGDMSLIGPRPHPVGMTVCGRDYVEVVPDYHARHAVRPGITGLAQISGYRGPVDTVEQAAGRHEHDLDYVRNLGWRRELSILVRSIVYQLSIGGRLPAPAGPFPAPVRAS